MNKPRRQKVYVLCGLLLLFFPLSSMSSDSMAIDNRSNLVRGSFFYTFTESTGPNQSIELSGQDVPIEFDKKRSNSMALQSLLQLKWSVLGPNCHGRMIKLYGLYESDRGIFVLDNWMIKIPFRRTVVGNEAIVPTTEKYVLSRALMRSDFDKSPEFNPNSSKFDPLSHESINR